MSVREQIIEKLLKAGYDSFIACEEADRIIKEFLNSQVKERIFYFRHSTTTPFSIRLKSK